MKIIQKSGYVFSPGSNTIDFSAVPGFDVRGLYAVINLTADAAIYAVGLEGSGYSQRTGSVLTLKIDTSGMAENDELLVIYDDGLAAATAPLQSAGNALLTSILGALPSLVNGRSPVDGSGVTQPVSAAALPLPAGAATAARQDTAAATLASILSALQAQIDLETSVWTDGAAFFVRRESVNEGTGAITVSFTAPDGTAASPNAANLRPASSDNAVQLIQALFDVKTAGTGYSVGDQLARVVAVNKATNPPTASGAIWINLTTGAVITAPPAANIAETDQNVTTLANQGQSNPNAIWGVSQNANPFAGGLNTLTRIVSAAASTNPTLAKNSVGRVYKITGFNAAASVRWLRFYNKASAPVPGTDTPFFAVPLPPGPFAMDAVDLGYSFSAGIAFALTTGAADNDTGPLTAGDIQNLNVWWQ